MKLLPVIIGTVFMTSVPGVAQVPSVVGQAQSEALSRLGVAIEESLLLDRKTPIKVAGNTRGAQITALFAFKARFEDEFLMTPIPRKSRGIPFQSLTSEENERLRTLVEGGFIPSSSAIALENRVATDDEFGEALGWTVLRVLELSHEPDPSFSPYLKPPGL